MCLRATSSADGTVRRIHRGTTEICWAEGTLVVSVDHDVLLIDAPPVSVALLQPWLPNVRAIALTSGRLSSVGGLLPMLCALEPHRGPDSALTLHLPGSDERGAALAEVWVRCWPDRYPLTIDSDRPGSDFEVGRITVHTHPLETAEIVHGAASVQDAIGMIVRTPDLAIAYLRGMAPPRMLERWLAVDLAILEVGLSPWPRTDRPLRLRIDEASRIGASAGELWLVSDEGRSVDLAPRT